MAKSHAAVWAEDAPSPAQLKEFFAQIESGKITHARLQSFLRKDDQLDLSEIVPSYMELIDPVAPAILKSPADLVSVPFHNKSDHDYVRGYTMLERAKGLKCNLGWSDLLLCCYKEQEKISPDLCGKFLVFAKTRAQYSSKGYVFYLYWCGRRWLVRCRYLGRAWPRSYVLVRSGK